MFDVLMHSRVRWRFSPGKGVLVAALHGVVVAGAVRLGGEPPAPVRGPTPETTLFIVQQPTGAAPMPVAAPALPGTPSFELPAPLVIPEGIPPVLPGPALDPAALRQALTARRPGPPGPPAPLPSGADPVPGAQEVDEPAAAIRQPAPRYPAALRVAQVEGRVLLEFVIDTTGRVESGSLRVIESTHHGFEASARETLERSLFRPARLAGRPVRQRTLQAVAFRIRPD